MTKVSTQEAAEILGVIKPTLYGYIRRGRVSGVKHKGVWQLEKDSVLKLKKRLEKSAKQKKKGRRFNGRAAISAAEMDANKEKLTAEIEAWSKGYKMVNGRKLYPIYMDSTGKRKEYKPDGKAE